jgi:2-desacetyl-2-hydroxyethyl bacteriochlorophyllide A dehydrogenase
MRAAVFHGPGWIVAEDVADPVCEPEDVLVAVGACGICGSDMHAYEHGLYVTSGQVMGHEFAGRIAEVGASVEGIAVGDRVAVMPYRTCGGCDACDGGRPHLCRDVTSASIAYGLPGGFAEVVRVPGARLGGSIHRVGDDVPDAAAALCEPLSVALHGIGLARPAAEDRVVVVGQGPLGLLVVQALRARGVGAITAVDVASGRLDVAAEVGATRCIVADGRPLRELLGGRVDVVFECTGVEGLVDQALRALVPGGTVVTLGVYPRRVQIDASLVVRRELRLQGGFAATVEDFAASVALIDAGEVRHEPLISHRFDLDDIAAAFATQADRAGAVKVMIEP